MFLATRVNILNDTGERIKLKIDNNRDRKYDAIVNIEPGGRLDRIEGSVRDGFDVIIDIVINPVGPNNNTRLGGFKFNKPSAGDPNVRSDEFTTLDLTPNQRRGGWMYYLSRIAYFRDSLGKKYWGRFSESLLGDIESPYDIESIESNEFGPQVALLVNNAPKPTFTIESFSGAYAEWDLRINSDNFTLRR
jgi:hypothetical protein